MTSPRSPSGQLLLHDCTAWRQSSQAAANLYISGVKLWTRQHLLDIEQQLAQSRARQFFTLHLIDGTRLNLANPMFGQDSPIWQPRVRFREYWRLVRDRPDGPPETYHCSYLLSWINTTARSFCGIVPNPSSLLEHHMLAWKGSRSCQLLTLQLQQLPIIDKVKRILCFGLGDMCRKPPALTRPAESDNENWDVSFVRGAMIQHSIALTLAQICSQAADTGVQLLAQDPDYTCEAKQILQNLDFSIVGPFGAGGFAQVDDESLVFSVFIEAPLKQIIADIARPLIIIGTGFDTFNDSEKPWIDADSPRTEEMWKEYEQRFEFPIATGEEELMSSLRGIYLYIRKAGHLV